MNNEIKAKEISDDKLKRLYSRIKPIVRDKDGCPRFIKRPKSLRTIAYTWDPRKEGQPQFDLVELAREDRVLITFGYYGFFKPTIAECLAYLPDGVSEECIAFEIVEQPETAGDLNKNIDEINAGYQVCSVVYYGKAA